MLVQIDVVVQDYSTKRNTNQFDKNFFYSLILEDNILDQQEERDDDLILQNEH
jgi:hypothetical protein